MIAQNQGLLDAAETLLARAAVVDVRDIEGAVRIEQLLYRRRYADAARLILRSLRDDDARLTGPDIANLVFLGYAQKWAGDTAAAQHSFARAIQALEQSPDTMEHTEILGQHTLALAYAGIGERGKAAAAGALGVAHAERDAIQRAFAEIALAQVHAQAGDRDAVIAMLPHLLETPAGLNPALLRLDPIWDPIRDDPRFVKLSGDPAAAKP